MPSSIPLMGTFLPSMHWQRFLWPLVIHNQIFDTRNSLPLLSHSASWIYQLPVTRLLTRGSGTIWPQVNGAEHQGNCMAICHILKVNQYFIYAVVHPLLAAQNESFNKSYHLQQPFSEKQCKTTQPFLRNSAKQMSDEVPLEESGLAISSLQKSQTS